MASKAVIRSVIPEGTRILLRKLVPRLTMLDTFMLKDPSLVKEVKQIDSRYIIREAASADIEALQEAHLQRGPGAFERKVKRRLDAGRWHPLVVIDTTNGKIAYISWVVTGNPECFREFGIELSSGGFLLKDVYCVPRYRKQGLHTRMEHERINYCVNRGATEIYIQLHKSNIKGAQFMKRLGFERVGRTLIIQWSYFLVYRPLGKFLRRPFKRVVD